MRIVIPGGSGQIGGILARHFVAAAHDVTVLTRRPRPAPWQELHWDGVTVDDWVESLEGADVCINLAGRSVNCRYTAANRRAISPSGERATNPPGNSSAMKPVERLPSRQRG